MPWPEQLCVALEADLRLEWHTGSTPVTGEVEVARVSGGEGCEEAEAGLGGLRAERGSSVWGWARRESCEGRV